MFFELKSFKSLYLLKITKKTEKKIIFLCDFSSNEFGSAIASSSIAMHKSAAATVSNSSGRARLIKKSEAISHPITVNGREIIQFCWENASLDFVTRLCTRIFEKRSDFQKFSQQMGREKWFEMVHNLRDFLYQVISKVKF